jgi:hypothetical protein
MAKYAVPALIAVIALLGGFYGGFRFGQTNASANSAASGNGGNGASANATPGAGRNACSTTAGTGRNGANANRAAAFGQVTNVSGTTLTIHNSVCNTDTKVTLSGTPVIRKTVDGTAGDLSNGACVTVTGTKNSDGSITVTSASVQPQAGQGCTTSSGGGAGGGGGVFGGGGGGGGGAAPFPPGN